MPTTTLMPLPKQQYLSVLGTPLVGGKVYTYAAGTTNPKATFTDAAGTTAQPNPIPLNARGEPSSPIYWSGNYRVELRDALGVLVYSVDDYNTDPAGVWTLFGQLISAAGSSLVGFILGVTGSIARTVMDKLRERPSLLDFMTDAQRADVLSGAAAIDVTVAVQKAIDAYIDPVMPSGRYRVSAPLVITSNLNLKGNKRKSIFVSSPSFAAGNVTRTYLDGNGVVQTLNWNDKAVFYLVPPNNSYLTDVSLDGVSFELPADGSIGVINAKRTAISSFRNLYCNSSAYFAKCFDVWMTEWANIRSQFSKDNFNIDTGTSNSFTNCYANTKHSSGGNGFTFTNLNYTTMNACGADSLDRAYYFNNSTVTMNGCGAETFSRILHAVGGSNITINGGSLAVYKATSATGSYIPYAADGANTKVTMVGGWLGIKNPEVVGGTYDKMIITNGAQVSVSNIRQPSELGTPWWFVNNSGSLLTLADGNGTRYITPAGASRVDGVNNLKAFEYNKTIPAGSAQSIFRISATAAGSGYGDSCTGKIRVYMINGYGVDLGFSGFQEYIFSAFKETTTAQNITKIAESFTSTNTGIGALGAITGTLLRNGDGTIDFQLNVGNVPVVADTRVWVFVEYMTFSATSASSNSITGV